MGNQTSQGLQATGKVILLDGSIHEFDESITVAELMLEYPQQVVVELKEATKPTPLPADKKLEVDKLYLMVPLRRGKPAHLSVQEAHNILLRANAILKSKTLVNSSKFLPFFARICPAGDVISGANPSAVGGQGKIVVSKKDVEKCVDESEVLELTERPDYLSRTLSGRGWKPKLDTIEEKKDEVRKVSNWVVLASKIGKRVHHKGLVWG